MIIIPKWTSSFENIAAGKRGSSLTMHLSIWLIGAVNERILKYTVVQRALTAKS
jgi:hypothetical protein